MEIPAIKAREISTQYKLKEAKVVAAKADRCSLKQSGVSPSVCRYPKDVLHCSHRVVPRNVAIVMLGGYR
jgi:hypothetical protein